MFSELGKYSIDMFGGTSASESVNVLEEVEIEVEASILLKRC